MIKSIALILGVLAGIFGGIADSILVAAGLKWQPFTGRARWIGRLPRPDFQANAWQRHIRPPQCRHRDATGVSWCIVTMVRHDGATRPARACVQCHAYRLVLSDNELSSWHQGGSVVATERVR